MFPRILVQTVSALVVLSSVGSSTAAPNPVSASHGDLVPRTAVASSLEYSSAQFLEKRVITGVRGGSTAPSLGDIHPLPSSGLTQSEATVKLLNFWTGFQSELETSFKHARDYNPEALETIQSRPATESTYAATVRSGVLSADTTASIDQILHTLGKGTEPRRKFFEFRKCQYCDYPETFDQVIDCARLSATDRCSVIVGGGGCYYDSPLFAYNAASDN